MKAFKKIFILLFLISCGNSTEFKEEPSFGFLGQFPVEGLDFNRIQSQVLAPNCIQCHSNYTNYDVVFKNKDRILAAVLNNTMPKNAAPLSDDLKGILSAWVRAGAPQGRVEDEDGEVVKLEANWESLSRNVFGPKCIQCHNPNGEASFLDLSSRQKFFDQRAELLNNFEDAQNSYLVEVITDPDEPMPPAWAGFERLSDEEVQTIIKWIEKGIP